MHKNEIHCVFVGLYCQFSNTIFLVVCN
jgi:hypothetical protein